MHDFTLQHGTMVDFGAGDNQSDNLSDPEAAFGFDERTPAAYIINGTAEVLILGGEIDRLVIRFSWMFSHLSNVCYANTMLNWPIERGLK